MPISGNFIHFLFLHGLTPSAYSSLVIQPTVVSFGYDCCVGFTFLRIDHKVQDPCIELEEKTPASEAWKACP